MNHKIDLHGLTHNEAIKKVESELIRISLTNYYQVEIITGKSKLMQDKIINEVLGPLKFFYYIPIINEGVIIVCPDDLL
jgi:dsDNA-specific endonuclease/ATPase MutS2